MISNHYEHSTRSKPCSARPNTITSILLLTLYLFAPLQPTRKYNMVENKTTNVKGKPEWKAKTKGYESSIFFFGKNPAMQNTYVESDIAIRDYIGIKLSTNTLLSMINNKLTITDIEPPKDFTSQAEMNREFAGSVIKKLDWEDNRKAYNAERKTVKQNLGRAATVLWSHCHITIRTKLAADKEFQANPNIMSDAGNLYRLITKIMNGSNSVQSPTMTAIESTFNLFYIKGSEYEILAQYAEAFQHKVNVADRSGFSFANEVLRDHCITEFTTRNDTSDCMNKLVAWKDATDSRPTADGMDGTYEDDNARNAAFIDMMTEDWWNEREEKIQAGRKALHDFMLAALFLKRSGPVYDSLRGEGVNDYAKGSNNQSKTMAEQFTQMEYWTPAYRVTAQQGNDGKQKEIRGSQHYQNNGKEKILGDCFRCGRPGCRNCKETKKANGDPVNTEEEIEALRAAKRKESNERFAERIAKYNKKKEDAEKSDKDKETTTGTGMYMGGEIIPSPEEMEQGSDSENEDGDHVSWAFNTRTISIDLRNTNHVFNQAAFNQAGAAKITTLTQYQILNDNQSTSDIIVYKGFVINIRKSRWTLVLRTQSGICKIDHVADMPGVGTVWYYPEGAANILSGHRLVVNSGWSVKQDSDRYHQTGNTDDLSIRCVTKEGVRCEFKPTVDGLHVMDCEKLLKKGKHIFGRTITDNGTMHGEAMGSCHHIKAKADAHCFAEGVNKINNSEGIDTVKGSIARLSKRDQMRVLLTRRLQHVAGHPSDDTLIYAAVTNSIMGCPITREDVLMALEYLGKSGYAVAGKTTRTQPDEVAPNEALVELPPTILNYYKDVVLSIDILFVNRVPFLATISRNIHYGTIAALPNMKIETLEREIESVMRGYSTRGFHVKTILVDLQFKAIKDRNNLSVLTNVCSRDEHIPEIERFIRVIKERARCYYAMLLRIGINTLPKGMIMQLMRTVVYYINSFVWRKGVSQILPPVTIVEGLKMNFKKHFPAIYGEYMLTFEGTTNGMDSRTTGALAMGPSTNIQGGIRCYSLTTGKILHRLIKDCTLMKMPHTVLGRLRYINKREKSIKGLVFGNRNDEDDPDNEIEGVLATDANENYPDHVNNPSDLATENNFDAGNIDQDNDNVEETTQQEEQEEYSPDEGHDNEITGLTQEENETALPEHANDEIAVNETAAVETQSDHWKGSAHAGRASRPYDYENTYGTTNLMKRSADDRCIRPYYQDEDLNYHLSKGITHSSGFFTNGIVTTNIEIPTFEEKIENIEVDHHSLYVEALEWFDFDLEECTGMAFKAKQMNVKQGIKQFGDDGKASALKEIKNLTGNECFGEIDYETLTQTQKDKALPILMFMIMKRNGDIKSRAVANGSLQRVYTNKDDCSSPTPDYYAFKYVIAVIAKEGRDCATVDLPGFFLQTEQEENSDLLLKLTGQVTTLLIESDEDKWRKHLRQENGKDVLYVKCDKAIYGTMNAALLAYKKLAKLFSEWGFVMNPYDPCVWNKKVGKHQMSIMFHIDDLLMSHKHPHIVTLFIKKLEAVYGKRDPLTVTRGLVHEYLGMTFDLREKGEVALSQYDFVKKLYNELPDDMKEGRYRYTPAPEDLFKIKEDSPKLDCARKETYHCITAKTLWLSQRSRSDIQLATGYHCSRVKEPNEDDWNKLKWLMRYVWWTRFIPTIIGITEEGAIIYIDGSHAIHADTKGHSGMYTTMGKGALINVARKLGLVTISSTETEVVSTGERMPKCTWFRYFRIAQGDSATEDILMQDNKSAILLQKNWPFSTGKGSKHINIRYFFVVDKIKNKEVKIIYCPTEEMIADFNTKPLQGKLFFYFRDKIMGINKEHFARYKAKYVESLKQYGLYENEDDLDTI